ncbi:unknown [Clostridium sp. CAG:768]|nr:unknown [Clostridium sp. CAG:768]
MSLVIDSNLEYLQNILHISKVTFEEKYANMSVDEIIEAEAASGNQQAIELAQELTTNTSLVMELFDLADTNNKYMILRELTAQQLEVFLPEMEEKDLLQGLFFFTQDKLMKMLEELPAEQLVNTAFELFSQEEIVQLMPEEQLDKFLTSTDIDKNKILKHMQSIPPEYVAQVLEQITGESHENMDSIDLSKEFGELNPLEYQDALKAFQPTQKQQLVLSLGKEHEEWFQLFDAHAYTTIMNREKQQPEVVKAMSVIEPEYIQNMITELPNDLLSLVITQMDTEKFTEILMDEFPEVIAEIIMK